MKKKNREKEFEFYGIMSKVFRKYKVLPDKRLDKMDRELKEEGVDSEKIDKIMEELPEK